MFYGLFPPEVNSGMFDTGLGPVNFAAAGLQWEVLAASFATQTAAASANVAASVAVWQGGAPVSFQMASSKLIAWLQHAQAVCQKNATACFAVCQAWAAARMTMVPLPAVIANRVAAASAEATTVAAAAAGPIGAPIAVSSAATAAQLEAAYAAMWTMDATTMSTYHGLIVAATTPSVLPPPPILTEMGMIGTESTMRAAMDGATALGRNGGEKAIQKTAQQAMQNPAQQALGQATSMPSQMMSSMSGMGSGARISDGDFNRMLRGNGLNPGAYGAPDLGSMAGFSGSGSGAGASGGGTPAGLGVSPTGAALADLSGVPPSAAFDGVAPMPVGAPVAPGSPLGGGGGGMMPPMGSPTSGARNKTSAPKTDAVLRAHPEFGGLLTRGDDGLLHQLDIVAAEEMAGEMAAEEVGDRELVTSESSRSA